MAFIDIYTDGSALGNPGPGGYAAVLLSGDRRLEISGGFSCTTNNRMELMAVVEALQALRGNDIPFVCTAIPNMWWMPLSRTGLVGGNEGPGRMSKTSIYGKGFCL